MFKNKQLSFITFSSIDFGQLMIAKRWRLKKLEKAVLARRGYVKILEEAEIIRRIPMGTGKKLQIQILDTS